MFPKFVIFFALILLAIQVAAQPATQSKPQPKQISGGILNGKAIYLPKPIYPVSAAAVKVDGTVNVKILVDEAGNVVSVEAISGNPLLRASAEDAARLARFSPTMLSGVPVKVSGTISYNFVLEDHPLEIPPEERHLVWLIGFVFSVVDAGGFGVGEGVEFKEEINKILADLAIDLPDELKGEQHVFDRLKNASEADRPAAIKEVLQSIKRVLSADEKWQVGVGELAGISFSELVRQLVRARNDEKIDDSALKASLNGLHEKLLTRPEGVPARNMAIFAEMAKFKDAADLNSVSGLVRLFEVMEPLSEPFQDEK